MAKAVKKPAKPKSAKAPPRARPATVSAPVHRGSKPTPRAKVKAPALPAAPPAPPPPSPADRQAALEAALTRLWAGLPRTWLAGGTVACVARTKLVPYWHLVATGRAGDGLALSLRVPRQPVDAAPPAWAVSLMETLAHPSLSSLGEGQSLRLDRFGGPESELSAVAFDRDPELVAGPLVRVLAVVGLTADEERTARAWSPTGFLEIFAKVSPLWLTDDTRASLLHSPRTRMAIDQRVEREGSSMGTLTEPRSEVSESKGQLTWRLGSGAVDTVLALLKGRTGHLRPFSVVSQSHVVEVVAGDAPHAQLHDTTLTLKLSQPAARALRATLKARPGRYTWDQLPQFALEVEA